MSEPAWRCGCGCCSCLLASSSAPPAPQHSFQAHVFVNSCRLLCCPRSRSAGLWPAQQAQLAASTGTLVSVVVSTKSFTRRFLPLTACPHLAWPLIGDAGGGDRIASVDLSRRHDLAQHGITVLTSCLFGGLIQDRQGPVTVEAWLLPAPRLPTSTALNLVGGTSHADGMASELRCWCVCACVLTPAAPSEQQGAPGSSDEKSVVAQRGTQTARLPRVAAAARCDGRDGGVAPLHGPAWLWTLAWREWLSPWLGLHTAAAQTVPERDPSAALVGWQQVYMTWRDARRQLVCLGASVACFYVILRVHSRHYRGSNGVPLVSPVATIISSRLVPPEQ